MNVALVLGYVCVKLGVHYPSSGELITYSSPARRRSSWSACSPLSRCSSAGLLITAALVLAVANLVDLSAIASVGSAVALMTFVLVGIAGWRRRKETEGNTAIVLIGLVAVGLDAVVRRRADAVRSTDRPP